MSDMELYNADEIKQAASRLAAQIDAVLQQKEIQFEAFAEAKINQVVSELKQYTKDRIDTHEGRISDYVQQQGLETRRLIQSVRSSVDSIKQVLDRHVADAERQSADTQNKLNAVMRDIDKLQADTKRLLGDG